MESMLDLFNTKLFFRCTELSSQQWISKVLGDKEEAEPTENISYGAKMRDGVSLSRHTRQKPLILPAELSQLKDLECYLKLPGNYPCTKIQTSFQRRWFSKKEKISAIQNVQRVTPFLAVSVPSMQKKIEEHKEKIGLSTMQHEGFKGSLSEALRKINASEYVQIKGERYLVYSKSVSTKG